MCEDWIGLHKFWKNPSFYISLGSNINSTRVVPKNLQ